MKSRLIRFLVNEWFFVISLTAFLISIAITQKPPSFDWGDFRVIFILFVFLLIVKGLEESNFLSYIALKLEEGKFVTFKLTLASFVLAALITNDVALLTVVPLSLHLRKVNIAKLVVLETLAANAGSMLTPIGNPQNIFIYHHYSISLTEFVKVTIPYSILFLILILLLLPKDSEKPPTLKEKIAVDRKLSIVFLAFFLLFVPSALRFLPIWVGIFPILYALFFKRKLLIKVDYFLLLTFLFFFGFTSEISKILSPQINGSLQVFLYSVGLSQILSNVPAALLMADFTRNWQALLLGVNVGGFGTLIASLANLISYKIYTSRFDNRWELLKLFHLTGFLFLFLGLLVFLLSHSEFARLSAAVAKSVIDGFLFLLNTLRVLLNT